VLRPPRTIVVLTAGALALGAADAAHAKSGPAPSPCRAPDSGFQSCLRVLYKAAGDGTVDDVRVTATLVRRLTSCHGGFANRRLVLRRRDGDRLESARRPGHCKHGIVTWRATFSSAETADWDLHRGDTVDATWSGVRKLASVEISGG
jgi:hypothetical protein